MTLSATLAGPTAAAPPRRSRLGFAVQMLRPLAVDLVGSLSFGGLYVATHSLVLATAVGVGVGVAAIGWKLWRRQPVASLQWASLGLVVAMGALALATNDPRIVMVKPSIICAVIGVGMLQKGWMLRYALPHRLIPTAAFVGAGYGWAALLLISAALNLAVALTAGPKAWALFVAIYPLAAKIGGFALQFLAFAVVAGVNRRRERRRERAAAQAAYA